MGIILTQHGNHIDPAWESYWPSMGTILTQHGNHIDPAWEPYWPSMGKLIDLHLLVHTPPHSLLNTQPSLWQAITTIPMGSLHSWTKAQMSTPKTMWVGASNLTIDLSTGSTLLLLVLTCTPHSCDHTTDIYFIIHPLALDVVHMHVEGMDGPPPSQYARIYWSGQGAGGRCWDRN